MPCRIGRVVPADVDAAGQFGSRFVVERHAGRLRDMPGGEHRQIDDGILQTLAPVDRHELHRAASLSSRRVRMPVEPRRSSDIAVWPGKRDQAEVVASGDVEHLGDVPQIGQ